MRRVVFVLFAALALCSCQGINKTQEREPALTYVDWTMTTRKTSDGQTGYLLGTSTNSAETGKSAYALLVPISVVNCGPTTPALGVMFSEPLKELSRQKVEVTVRVDELAPVTVEGFYEAHAGKDSIFVEMPDFFKSKALLDQMPKGQSVRFSLRVLGKDYTIPFTLRNHVSVMKHAMDLCEESAHFFQGGKSAPGQGPRQAPAAPNRQQPSDDSDDSRYFKK